MHPRISRVMWCGGGCSQDDAVMRAGGCRELCSAHWPTALGETKNCTSANKRSLHFVDTLIFPPLSLSLVGDWASCPQCIRCKLWPEARPSLSQNKRSQLQGENQTIFPINGNFLAKNSACRSCWCLVVTHYSGWFLSALRYAPSSSPGAGPEVTFHSVLVPAENVLTGADWCRPLELLNSTSILSESHYYQLWLSL